MFGGYLFPSLSIQILLVKDSGGMGKEETARQLKEASEGRVESVLLCSSEENGFIDRQLLDSCSRTVFAAEPHKYSARVDKFLVGAR